MFGALVATFGGNLPATPASANALGVQAWIAAAFHLFILTTSNPFLRFAQAPFEGRDLNPILQDFGLAIHPPLLYLGYVGFSISFSFAIAALIEGRIDAAWARWVRPWTLAAWMFLTLGIAMGSYWAYYELGWGGFWFWDPVENASLMPWLAGTALLHSAVVMEKRNALKVWTILLAILAFSLSLIGTFLVRSGVLTSVHAFANDPTRGVFILAILVLFIGGGLALFAWRAPLLKQGGLFAPISREGALVLNNLFLTAACATVFVGTLYPLALEALTGEKISVGAPFFNPTFGPLFMPLLMVVPFGPLLAWKRGDLLGVAQRLIGAAGLAAPRHRGDLCAHAAAAGAGAVRHRARDLCHGRRADRPRRAHRPVPRAACDRVGARARTAALGVRARRSRISASACRCSASSARRHWGAERIVALKPGADHLDAAPTISPSTGIEPRQGPNYRELAAQFTVRARRRVDRRDGAVEAHLSLARNSATTEAALMTRGVSQLYLSLGDPNADGSHRGAALSQAAGAADLARRGGDGASAARCRCPTGGCGSARPSRRAASRRCSRRSRTMRVAQVMLIALALLSAGCCAHRWPSRCSPTRCWPIRRSKRARARCRRNCAAWSARTSRSTIPMRRWRTICACWCASGSRPATATTGARLSGRALWPVRAAQAAFWLGHRAALACARRSVR